VAIRQALELFACVRPAKSYPGIKSKFSGIDLVVIRENSEDLYMGVEFEEGKPATRELISQISSQVKKDIRMDSGISIKPISRSATERITRFALEYALKNGRKKSPACIRPIL